MKWIIVLTLLVLLLYLLSKWVIYCATTRGLLYYLANAHNDLLDADKVKELRDTALQRMVREFLQRESSTLIDKQGLFSHNES